MHRTKNGPSVSGLEGEKTPAEETDSLRGGAGGPGAWSKRSPRSSVALAQPFQGVQGTGRTRLPGGLGGVGAGRWGCAVRCLGRRSVLESGILSFLFF